MFRISKNGQEEVAGVASYRQIVPSIREAGPGPTAAKCVRPLSSAGLLSQAGTNPLVGDVGFRQRGQFLTATGSFNRRES
jgi:hypothetical protein